MSSGRRKELWGEVNREVLNTAGELMEVLDRIEQFVVDPTPSLYPPNSVSLRPELPARVITLSRRLGVSLARLDAACDVIRARGAVWRWRIGVARGHSAVARFPKSAGGRAGRRMALLRKSLPQSSLPRYYCTSSGPAAGGAASLSAGSDAGVGGGASPPPPPLTSSSSSITYSGAGVNDGNGGAGVNDGNGGGDSGGGDPGTGESGGANAATVPETETTDGVALASESGGGAVAMETGTDSGAAAAADTGGAGNDGNGDDEDMWDALIIEGAVDALASPGEVNDYDPLDGPRDSGLTVALDNTGSGAARDPVAETLESGPATLDVVSAPLPVPRAAAPESGWRALERETRARRRKRWIKESAHGISHDQFWRDRTTTLVHQWREGAALHDLIRLRRAQRAQLRLRLDAFRRGCRPNPGNRNR